MASSLLPFGSDWYVKFELLHHFYILQVNQLGRGKYYGLHVFCDGKIDGQNQRILSEPLRGLQG